MQFWWYNPSERLKDRNGGIAQLGEHLPCKQGVRSSNLLVSTIKHLNKSYCKYAVRQFCKYFWANSRRMMRKEGVYMRYMTDWWRNPTKKLPKSEAKEKNMVTIEKEIHLFPSRTQKLSLSSLMILGVQPPGKGSRSQFQWPLGQAVKTPPFHGGNRGSNPLGVTKEKENRET